MRRRLTTEERENIEERFRGETLYRYASDACLPFVRGLKTFRLSGEEFFVAAAEALDDVKDDPDEARCVCRGLCDSLQRDFREIAGDDVPDEEITLAVVCVVTFVSVCLSLMEDSTCRSCVMDLAMGLEEYACGGLDREARERMFPSVWRRGEGGLKRWIDEYWRSEDYLTDVIHDMLYGETENDFKMESPVYLNTGKGYKINLIRVLNVLYELNFFRGKDGGKLTKKEFFSFVGTSIHLDLTNYDKDLSRALTDSTSLEKHLNIFDEMKKKMEDIFNSR